MSLLNRLDALHETWRTAGSAAQLGGELQDAYDARDAFSEALLAAWPEIRLALVAVWPKTRQAPAAQPSGAGGVDLNELRRCEREMTPAPWKAADLLDPAVSAFATGGHWQDAEATAALRNQLPNIIAALERAEREMPAADAASGDEAVSDRDTLACPLRVTAKDGCTVDLAPGTEFDAYRRPEDATGMVRVVTFTREDQRVWLEFWRVDENELRAAATNADLAIVPAQPVSERDLSLPLMDDGGSSMWAGIEATHRDQHVWPALIDALSDAGRGRLWEALHEAVDATPGDPERALKVVEAFHRTMLLRRGSHYARRVLGRLGARAR